MDDITAAEATAEPVSEPSLLDNEALYATLRGWFKLDMAHSAEWRTEAKFDFGFAVGDQWKPDDRATLEDQKRPVITFNRCLSIIKAVAGIEINGRHDTVYIPRNTKPGVVKANEMLTAASQWMGDVSDAEDEQSEAFQDAVVCGMGWTEPRISYDDEPDGMYAETKVDPLEMYWDRSARAKNLQDARRLFRVRKFSLDEARDFAKNLGMQDVFDDDLDATWATGADTEPGKPVEEKRHRDENSTAFDDKAEVHIVHAQWIERKAFYRVGDRVTGRVLELDDEKFAQYQELALEHGLEYTYVRQTRKVYKQAFLGKTILGGVMDCPGKDRFTFQCITGERDRNKGTWFGLIKVMRDPQMWANKWLSQTLHILNTTAKGGIIAEKDAFADEREAQDTYAQPDAITWAAKDAIQKGKIMQKPGVGIPTAYVNLLEFAISSIRDVTGINLELLGMRDANQPGILEHQRKQAAMTILATMFDALRRYRKNIGRVRLHYIQNFLSDGRLIRITQSDDNGKEVMMLVPLLRDQTVGDYEVIIDDAPNSPNQKQETWQFLMQLMPVFKGMMTPDAAVAMLEYSPLPSKLVETFKKLVQEQKAPTPEAQEQQAIAKRGAIAKVAKDEASAQKDLATADGARAEAMLDLANAAAAGAQADLDRVRAAVVSSLAPLPATRNIQDDYIVQPQADPTRTLRQPGPMPGIPTAAPLQQLAISAPEAGPIAAE
jgi:hypothetical protein